MKSAAARQMQVKTKAPVPHFTDRHHAGRVLADALAGYGGRIETMILALPRGGVPVAHEVSKALHEPLDLWIVRKLGVPHEQELAMGAITLQGHHILDRELIERMRVSPSAVRSTVDAETAEAERRNKLYRNGKALPEIAGKTVIVIDDGIATGATMRMAVESLRLAKASWIVAAAPVGAPDSCRTLESYADEVICPFTPDPFIGVGIWYEEFAQATDAEVIELLRGNAWKPSPRTSN
jgi:predicted phosphoribosyltransferase